MGKLKTAVIGTGFIGPAHIEALKRIGNVEVHGVTSLDVNAAKALAERYSIPRVYEKWQDAVCDKEIDVIHNCTPNNLHFEINKAALKEGKHVISEKPLTLTSTESQELLNLAEEKGLVNAVNFNYRFYPLMQHAKRMAEKGELGDIYLVHGHYLQDWLYYETDYNWRLEPGISGESRAVADIGSHWCDLVQFITGSRIKRVCADLLTVHKKRKRPLEEVDTFKGKEEKTKGGFEDVEVKTEDAASVLLQFENGARGVFTVSQISAGRKNNFWFEIDGSKKAISWDQEEPNELWIGYREKANEVLIKDPSLLDEYARRYAHYPGGHPEGYPDGAKNLFMNVYDFISKGKDPRKDKTEFPTFKDGHQEIKIVEAILKSSKEEKWVEVGS
ncbi:MAG: Gfo/Idh/MocA family oxidoreductase [Ignavibacteria bacterium]|jgi:predicted dehydrogenase|nr:Gfo/Idh/MocA family oxidoreductase [Ignavibacteria bacterium]MCU7504998.1 Gfo/Idh/MocA family oxidoreductase [Ignavibacteria bacterium]MCU7514868.1 Gfo/Idh/MocA family oxidoreductase [Ignavibacteria bacterium]